MRCGKWATAGFRSEEFGFRESVRSAEEIGRLCAVCKKVRIECVSTKCALCGERRHGMDRTSAMWKRWFPGFWLVEFGCFTSL